MIKMASTTKEKKKAREYYKENKAYRDEKISRRKAYAKTHKKEEAKQSKEYYWENPSYRKTRQKQARDYKRSHAKKK